MGSDGMIYDEVCCDVNEFTLLSVWVHFLYNRAYCIAYWLTISCLIDHTLS